MLLKCFSPLESLFKHSNSPPMRHRHQLFICRSLSLMGKWAASLYTLCQPEQLTATGCSSIKNQVLGSQMRVRMKYGPPFTHPYIQEGHTSDWGHHITEKGKEHFKSSQVINSSRIKTRRCLSPDLTFLPYFFNLTFLSFLSPIQGKKEH